MAELGGKLEFWSLEIRFLESGRKNSRTVGLSNIVRILFSSAPSALMHWLQQQAKKSPVRGGNKAGESAAMGVARGLNAMACI